MINKEKNIIIELQSQYYKALANKQKHSNKKYIRLLLAIETIERFNRIWIWRLVEYTVLISTLLQNNLFGKAITDYSVGKFQLKIYIILDMLGIRYQKIGKNCI